MLTEEKYQELKAKCPADCRMNQQGAYVPEELIDPVALQEDGMVTDMVSNIKGLILTQQQVKSSHIDSVLAHLSLSTGDAVTEQNYKDLSIPPFTTLDGRESVKVVIQPIFRANVRIAELQVFVKAAAAEVDGGKKLVQGILSLVSGKTVNTDLLKRIDATKIFSASASWKKAIQMLPDCLDEVDRRVYIRYYIFVDGVEQMLEVNWSKIDV